MKKRKSEHYSGDKIRSKGARYNVIFGERSNGKTYDVLYYGLEDYFKSGGVNQLGMIRRWEEDFVGPKSARTAYNSLMCNAYGENVVERISGGKYDGVEYYAGRYYLTEKDETRDKSIRTDKVVAYGFSLNSAEHYKSGSFPNIKTILFDEFLTNRNTLPDEFVIFQNLLSTIIRLRDDVVIYMCGNTVNRYSPYFKEMGLHNVKKMSPGDLEVYTYGESGLTVAVEFSDAPVKKKKSDVYFAFNNPKLKMITEGAWEIAIYPHCPMKYRPASVLYTYFILFDDELLQCEIVSEKGSTFTFIHRKTTPLKDEDRDLIYSTEHDPRPNYRRNITKPLTDLERKIARFYIADKVFYQDNEVGELVRNYLQWCKRAS